MRLARSCFTAIGSIMLLFAGTAHAGTMYYWYGSDTVLGGAGTWDGTSTYWSTVSTSKTGVAWPNTTAYDAYFGGATAGAVTLNSGSITAGGLTVVTQGYSITTGTLALGGDGINCTLTASGTATISANVNLLANQTWNVGARTLHVSGAVSGDYSIAKTGSGTLTLSGANTFTAGGTLSQGSLQIRSNSALGTGAFTLSGGTLGQAVVPASTSNTITNNITVADSVSAYIGRYTTGTNAPTTSLTLSGDLSGNNGGTLTFFQTNGTISLSGNNSGLYGTVVAPATNYLALRNAYSSSANARWVLNEAWSRLSAASNGDFELGELSGANTDSHNFVAAWDGTGAGTANVNFIVGGLNTSSSYGGSIVAVGGTVSLTKVGTGTLTLFGGVATAINGTTSINGGAVHLASLTALGGTGSIAFGGGTLVFSGSNTVDYSARFSAAANQAYSIDTNGQNVTFATGPGSSGGSLTKLGSGMLTLSGSSTYTGPTTVSAGALCVSGTTGSIAASSGVSVQGGASLLLNGGAVGSVSVASGAMLAGYGSTGSVSVASGGTIGSAADNATWGGTLAVTSLNLNGSVTQLCFGNVSVYTTAAALAVTDTNGFTTAGTLSINVYGAPVVGAGTAHMVQYSGSVNGSLNYTLGAINKSPRSGTYDLGTSAGSGVNYVDLTWNVDYPYWTNGAGDGIWSTSTASTTKNWALASDDSPTDYLAGDAVLFDNRVGASSATVTLGENVSPGGVTFNNGSTVSYTVVSTSGTSCGIGGSGGLTLNGAGTVTLLTNNTYGGVTTINAGTLQLGNGGTAGSLGDNSVLNSGALVFNRSDATTFAYVISGTGSVSQMGTGTLTLTADNTYSGTTYLNCTLQVGNGSTIGSIANSSGVVNDGALVFNRSNTYTYDHVISGTGSVSVMGGGALILSGDNTYTGTTTIAAGSTLQVGAGSTTGAIAGDIVNNGNFVFNRSNAYTYDRVISGAGNVTVTGSGTLILTGDNTCTGTTTIPTGSMLQIGDGGAAGSIATNYLFVMGGTLCFNRSDAYTFSKVLSGWGPVRVTGGGTLTLTCQNTYTQMITIDAGSTLRVSGTGTLGQTNNVIVDNGALVFNRSTAYTCANSITGDGPVHQMGPGALTLSGSNTYTGLTTVSAGTLTYGIAKATGPGDVLVSGGTLNLGSYSGTSAAVTLAGGAITGSGTLTSTSGFTVSSGAVSAVLAGAVGLTKSGGGAVTLSGGNTYTGTTTVEDGKLVVNGSLASPVDVIGGVLGGSGSIAGSVTVGAGTLAPGSSVATMTISNAALALSSSSTLGYELCGTDTTVGGSINDLIQSVTALTLDGTLNVTETVAGSFLSANYGDKWTLITYSGPLTDNGLDIGAMPTLSAGLHFAVDTTTAGQVNLLIVPEPGTLALLASGLIGLIAYAWRKRK
jgi:fibronectin-binding autotransporter adhesin